MQNPGVKRHLGFVDKLTFIHKSVENVVGSKEKSRVGYPALRRAILDYEKLVLVIGTQRKVHHEMSALWQ